MSKAHSSTQRIREALPSLTGTMVRIVAGGSAAMNSHFLTRTLPRVATEMAQHVLAYNLTRMMNILGVEQLIKTMKVVKV